MYKYEQIQRKTMHVLEKTRGPSQRPCLDEWRFSMHPQEDGTSSAGTLFFKLYVNLMVRVVHLRTHFENPAITKILSPWFHVPRLARWLHAKFQNIGLECHHKDQVGLWADFFLAQALGRQIGSGMAVSEALGRLWGPGTAVSGAHGRSLGPETAVSGKP